MSKRKRRHIISFFHTYMMVSEFLWKHYVLQRTGIQPRSLDVSLTRILRLLPHFFALGFQTFILILQLVNLVLKILYVFSHRLDSLFHLWSLLSFHSQFLNAPKMRYLWDFSSVTRQTVDFSLTHAYARYSILWQSHKSDVQKYCWKQTLTFVSSLQ